MSIAVSLALVVVFLLMNAFFVIAEFALVRVRKSQLELAIDEGKPGAKNAMKIAENVNAYLSACQLGITLASLALGWLGEPAISKLFEPLFDMLGLPEAAIVAISVAIGYFIMTTLHVVVGELIPKSFAIFATERWALRTATPLIWFYRITFPIMVMFNGITNAVVRLTGHDPANEHDVYTGEEIQLLIDESTESGLIDPEQNQFVDNIFDLGDKDAEAIMTPRMDVVCVDLENSLAEDLYTMPQGSTVHDLNIRTIEAVPEGMPIAKLLQVLQAKRTKIAVVIDEHGGTAGIVTMSDIIEQIVGRVDDEFTHDQDEEAVRMEDGSYLVEGTMPIDDLVKLLEFEPKEASECETAAGLLLALFDRIPQAGDKVELAHEDATEVVTVKFKVVMMDRLRIDKIRMAIEKASKEENGE